MNIRKVIPKEAVSIDLQGHTPDEVIQELIDLLAASGRLTDPKAARKAVRQREKKGSTALQHGIVLPHAKCDAVSRLLAAVGVHKAGIPSESLDGEPGHFFILTLSPANRAGPHIQFLAELGATLDDPDVRRRLLAATQREEVLRLLSTPPPSS